MANGQNVPAGWYHMQTDAPNTHRWWDGVQWTSETQAIGLAAPVPEPLAPIAESPFAQTAAQPVEAQPAAVAESPFAQSVAEPAQPVAAAAQSPFAQPAAQPLQPVAEVHTAEPAVEYGSMLTNDLASYWDTMEEPVDAAAKFAETSMLAAQQEAAAAQAEAEASEEDSPKRRRLFRKKKSSKNESELEAESES